jgi:hypothetical protein
MRRSKASGMWRLSLMSRVGHGRAHVSVFRLRWLMHPLANRAAVSTLSKVPPNFTHANLEQDRRGELLGGRYACLTARPTVEIIPYFVNAYKNLQSQVIGSRAHTVRFMIGKLPQVNESNLITSVDAAVGAYNPYRKEIPMRSLMLILSLAFFACSLPAQTNPSDPQRRLVSAAYAANSGGIGETGMLPLRGREITIAEGTRDNHFADSVIKCHGDCEITIHNVILKADELDSIRKLHKLRLAGMSESRCCRRAQPPAD